MEIKMTAAARKAQLTRRAAGAAFYMGAAVSVSANVYASQHTFIGVATGIWTPLAALLSLNLMERIEAKGRAALLRKVGVGFVALVAAYASYGHLMAVFQEAGADTVGTWTMPLTVDVLMAIARVAMLHRPSAPARRTRKPAAKVRQLKAVA